VTPSCSESEPRDHPLSEAIAKALEEVLDEGAESSPDAVIIGDRIGIVSWANAAWSQMTGIPLTETVDKPITGFLEVADIELELVDFVGQHFLAGRTCMVEFPFKTFDQREIQIHLEVRPIRRSPGELDGFLAIAQVVAERDISGSPLSLSPTR
jgi:PAS domain S-box-containing protein